MRHILVTNDFPPKVGGIQSYLWELWRRLDPSSFVVVTTPHKDAPRWDAEAPFEVVRLDDPWLLPRPKTISRVHEIADRFGATFAVIDPVVPLGLIGPQLKIPYVAVAHGAEYTIPARLRATSWAVRNVTHHAVGIIGGGVFVTEAAENVIGTRPVPSLSIPPGVDTERFRPLGPSERRQARDEFGFRDEDVVVVGVSRLVPRKGFDRLIRAGALLAPRHPQVRIAIAGSGRDDARLRRLVARVSAPVRFLGRVPDDALSRLYGAADVFCMPCHDRWFGLEQEGFGIVFVEAAAAGVPSVAGASGGSSEAVRHGETGLVVDGDVPSESVAEALEELVADTSLRADMGRAARHLAEQSFSYDVLASRLEAFLLGVFESHPSPPT